MPNENQCMKCLQTLIHKAISRGSLVQLDMIMEAISSLIEENANYQKRNRGRRLRLAILESKKNFRFISEIQDLQYRIRLRADKRGISNDKRSK